jgi:hypothetical protein
LCPEEEEEEEEEEGWRPFLSSFRTFRTVAKVCSAERTSMIYEQGMGRTVYKLL